MISEFADEKTVIHTANNEGVIITQKFSEIFPQCFNPKYLQSEFKLVREDNTTEKEFLRKFEQILLQLVFALNLVFQV